MPILARRCAMTGPGCRSTVTPPTSWQPSSLAQPADERPAFGRPMMWVLDAGAVDRGGCSQPNSPGSGLRSSVLLPLSPGDAEDP